MSRISRLAVVIGLFVVIAIIALGFVVTSPTNAATIDKLSVTCTITTVKGKTEVTAPFVRLQVVLASNLSIVLATRVEPVINRVGASYLLSARYEPQATNTLLVISVGEWDGSRYLQPATLTSRFCNEDGGSQPPTAVVSQTPSPTEVGTQNPSATPTLVPSLFPSPTGSLTQSPSATPSPAPSLFPSPTGSLTHIPSATPSPAPSLFPSPTGSLTNVPSATPTILPSLPPSPTGSFTKSPSATPSPVPSKPSS